MIISDSHIQWFLSENLLSIEPCPDDAQWQPSCSHTPSSG